MIHLYKVSMNTLTLLLPLLIVGFASNAQAVDLSKVSVMDRFIYGAVNTHGSMRDRLIEGTINVATPNADEQTRRVQRAAARYALANDQRESEKEWKEVREGLTSIVRKNGRVDKEMTQAYIQETRKMNCKVVNLGLPPGYITVKSGCFDKFCKSIDGAFKTDMGWGISGAKGDGPMWDINMTVEVRGGRAMIYQEGFQTLNWFENVLVKRVGDVVVFTWDNNTTFAMGDRNNKEPVSTHGYYSKAKELFSLLLAPGGSTQSIIKFGTLSPNPVLLRTCN